MKFKKVVLSVLASASILSLSVPSSYAAEPVAETSVYDVGSVVVSTNYTEQSLEQIVTPFYLLTNYNFGALSVNDTASSESFNHYSYGNVTVKLAQYPTYGSGTATAMYTLKNSEKDDLPVTGNYSSATKTITFNGVQSGTYYLVIQNIGNTVISGYGSVND
ncbi:hypothetical protein PMSD_27840 [Paenibacillus macquariensis subsp. defensor]|nr:hypothetical protein PMSD_27840 [Paenibacillus macquariensis subsp. defensor]